MKEKEDSIDRLQGNSSYFKKVWEYNKDMCDLGTRPYQNQAALSVAT